MKRVLLSLVLLSITSFSFGQKNLRQNASNLLIEGKLDLALEAINQCILNPYTSKDAKTWYIRGNIYLEISNSENINYNRLSNDPLNKAFESYYYANKYDTKKDYYEDIFAKLNWLRNNYFNAAVDSYNKKAYKDAMTGFENAASALSLANVSDTVSLFYAAACANLTGEKGKQKQYYTDLLNGGAKSIVIYVSLADIYRLEKDSATALKVIRAGQKVYPNNLQLTLSESNVYIYFNDVPKALSALNLAAAKDNTNYLVFNAIGINYQKFYEDNRQTDATRIDAFQSSEAAYLKAIELKPDFYDVQLNIASLYFNSAVPIVLRANALSNSEKNEFNKLVKEANVYYKLALPFLKKADKLQPNDFNTLNSLRQIYSSLNDKENLKDVQAKILRLKGGVLSDQIISINRETDSRNRVIHLEKNKSGTYTIKGKVNGLQLDFIFDTGASDVSLSLTEALFMLKNGYLHEEDILQKQRYSLANGSIEEGTRLLIRVLELDDFVLRNVEASIIHNLNAPLLLGQSALSKLGKIEIDFQTNTLTIKE